MKILLTGASGYIGSNLMNVLKEDHEIVAVSRSTKDKENEKNVEWRQADFFSQKDLEDIMYDIDIAIYLVHSMKPSSKLSQGTFGDMDAILADNFARASKKSGVKRIIYLSGIIPEDDSLSPHLASRLECEQILGSYGIPVTTIRASLIIGPNGSSYPILYKLVKRLPLLLLPKWAYNRTNPVALKDVISGFKSVIQRKSDRNEAIDIGGPDEMSYKDLFKETAEVTDKKLPMFDFPIIPVWLSKFWVHLIAGEPKEMVYPLLQSLVHDMKVSKSNYVEGISNGKTTFKEAVRISLTENMDENNAPSGYENVRQSLNKNDVKSVQRIRIPHNWTVEDTAHYYMNWLSRIGGPFINMYVNDQQECARIHIPIFKTPILELKRSHERSYDGRVLYYISGGKFSRTEGEGRARMEFRRILDKNEVIIALHEYEPTLPWFIYSLTQARVHVIVMTLFGMETKILANMIDSKYVKLIDQQNVKTN